MSDTAKLAIWHSLNCEAIYDDSGVSCTCDYDRAQALATSRDQALDELAAIGKADLALRKQLLTLRRLAGEYLDAEKACNELQFRCGNDLEQACADRRIANAHQALAAHLMEKP